MSNQSIKTEWRCCECGVLFGNQEEMAEWDEPNNVRCLKCIEKQEDNKDDKRTN